MALGIAASTVIYSVVDTVLLQPLDYEGSGDIYRVYTVDTSRPQSIRFFCRGDDYEFWGMWQTNFHLV